MTMEKRERRIRDDLNAGWHEQPKLTAADVRWLLAELDAVRAERDKAMSGIEGLDAWPAAPPLETMFQVTPDKWHEIQQIKMERNRLRDELTAVRAELAEANDRAAAQTRRLEAFARWSDAAGWRLRAVTQDELHKACEAADYPALITSSGFEAMLDALNDVLEERGV